MAFDFGLERIGVAIGNTLLKIPHPLITITGKNKYLKLEQIEVLVDKWQPSLFIVGMPIIQDGAEAINLMQKEQLINSIKNFKR